MDPFLAIALLTAFLVYFSIITGKNFRQEDQSSIDKDTEFIAQRTISDTIVPTVIYVFEHEPPEYGEDDQGTVDTLSEQLEPSFKKIATAYKYREVAQQSGRYLLRCGATGLIAEIIFIALIVGFGTDSPIISTTFSLSFVIFILSIIFWSFRIRSVERVEDMKEKL